MQTKIHLKYNCYAKNKDITAEIKGEQWYVYFFACFTTRYEMGVYLFEHFALSLSH
jgi:hypothetical protein